VAKRKRERMKQKTQRHKQSAVAAQQTGQQAEQPATTAIPAVKEIRKNPQSAVPEKKQPVVTEKKQPAAAVKKQQTTVALTGQRHLSAAAPEWKDWYAAVSREFAEDAKG
jgi:hypothetical protein